MALLLGRADGTPARPAFPREVQVSTGAFATELADACIKSGEAGLLTKLRHDTRIQRIADVEPILAELRKRMPADASGGVDPGPLSLRLTRAQRDVQRGGTADNRGALVELTLVFTLSDAEGNVLCPSEGSLREWQSEFPGGPPAERLPRRGCASCAGAP